MDQEIEAPPEARELAARARRIATPCGEGEMAWRTWGEGEPVLLLHGGSGSWTHWLRNIDALAGSGRKVVVPDLPGFGESAAPPGGGDADAVVEPLAGGLRDVLGDGAVDVVAFSFGALVAALWAARQHDRFSRLVLVGAPVVPLQRGRGVDLKPWSRTGSAEERLRVHRHNLGAIMLHRPESIDGLALALHAANVPRDRMRRRRLVTTPAFRDAMAHFAFPFSAIYGAQDVLMRGLWPELESALRGHPCFAGLHVIADAGHWVQYEAADGFNALLLAALSRG